MLKDILSNQPLISCEPDAKVVDAARMMEQKNVGDVLVLSNGKPRGILTDRDIVVRCIAKNIDVSDCTVEQVMTESLETININDGIYDVIQKMEKAGVRRIPVVDGNKAVGIVTFSDMVRILAKEFAHLTRQVTPEKEPPQERAA